MTWHVAGTAEDCGCCDEKCCVTLRYRLWIAAHEGGLGFFEVFEWELTDGVRTLSGQSKYSSSGDRHGIADDFSFSNNTNSNPAKGPFFFQTTGPDPGWMSPDAAYIGSQCQADEIILVIANSTFCNDPGRYMKFYGADSWSETVAIDWGPNSGLPNPDDWIDQRYNYKYGHTDWHEIELCEK